MDRWMIALTLLVCAPTLQAGVYNFNESVLVPDVQMVRGQILTKRSAAVPPRGKLKPEDFKYQVLSEVKRLEALRKDGVFSTQDRVSLSACYMRLGDRVPAALQLLPGGDRNDFFIQSNLAAAYFLSGEMSMAVRHQQRALAAWPEVQYGWNKSLSRFYRECELALLRLYQSRADEARRGLVRDNLDVDPIFGSSFRYVGASGKFEPGCLSIEMREKLPVDSLWILTQLSMWFPTDWRLYWQVMQMLSCEGAIEPAAAIADELTDAGLARSFKGLPDQRRALLNAAKSYKILADPHQAGPRGMVTASMMLIPRPLFAPPVAGDVAYQLGCLGTVVAMEKFAEPPIEAIQPLIPPDGTGSPPEPVFDFRHVAAGFGFGCLTATLVGMQWRASMRRRRRNQAVPEESTAIPPTG